MPTKQSLDHSSDKTSSMNWPVVVWALYVGSIVTLGATMLVGAIIAYVKRAQLTGTPAHSHMT